MCTTLLNDSSLLDHWERFTSSNVSLNSSSSTGTIRGFKGIATSFTMIESSLASTKTKRIVGTIFYLYSKGVDVFILKIRVGVMCGSDNGTS